MSVDVPGAEVTVTICPDGPLLLRGPAQLRTTDGSTVAHERTVLALCRCGRSRRKPLCDGSHRLSRFRDAATTEQLTHVLTHATPLPPRRPKAPKPPEPATPNPIGPSRPSRLRVPSVYHVNVVNPLLPRLICRGHGQFTGATRRVDKGRTSSPEPVDKRHIRTNHRIVHRVDSDDFLIPSGSGFFTRAKALALGETDRTLCAALRAGTLVRLRHGAYARRSDVDGLDERSRHLLLARAVLAQQRGSTALAGPSAALLRGFDVIGHDLDLVHLVRLDSGTGRREAGVVHHVAAKDVVARVRVHEGVLVVSPEDAVWQTALLSTLEGGVVTADSALHGRSGLASSLQALALRAKAQPRSRVARLAVRLARAEAESPGESLTRVACFRHGIPCPDLQHDVFDAFHGLIGRTDFYWEQARLLGEFDGKIKYVKLLREGETSSEVVVREKRREDAMRSTRCGMARFTWSEVQPDHAHRRMAQLAHELESSRRLYVSVAA